MDEKVSRRMKPYPEHNPSPYPQQPSRLCFPQQHSSYSQQQPSPSQHRYPSPQQLSSPPPTTPQKPLKKEPPPTWAMGCTYTLMIAIFLAFLAGAYGSTLGHASSSSPT